MSDKNSTWNIAATTGLYLGAISVLYFCFSCLSEAIGLQGILAGIITFILWTAKFVSCIWVMKFFLKKYREANPEAGLFNVGALASLLSALIYSTAYFVYVHIIKPDFISDTINTALQSVQGVPGMNEEAMSEILEMVPMMGTYTFFANLFYCTLYGVILTAILSGIIKKKSEDSI